jgi:hypothetical protein
LRIALGGHGGKDIGHPGCSRHQVQVFTESWKELDDIGLGDAVQSIAGFLKEIHMAEDERFKAPGETALTAPNASGNRPNFPQALCIQSDDSVGFPPSPAFEGNGESLVEWHSGLDQSLTDAERLLLLPGA